MSGIKIVLHKVRRANGTYPVRIRVTKNRRSKLFKTIFHALPGEFNEKTEQFTRKYPNHIQSNRVLLKFKDRALKVYADLEYENSNFSLLDFEKAFLMTAKPKVANKNFFYFWDEMIKELNEAGRTGDAAVHDQSFKALKKFNRSTKLEFEQINFTYLSKYENYLRSRGGTNGGISIKMRSIRTIFNRAIDREVTSANLYPFKKYKVSKLKSDPSKIALDYFDVMKIMQWDSSGYPHLLDSHNYFVFSFYTRGMNFTDQILLKWSQIGSNKIHYTRSKTKGKFSITILPPVQSILDYYKKYSLGTKYVFPILLKDDMTPMQIENRKKKTRQKYNRDLKEIAFHCEIDAKVSSYVARHSYANSLKQMGVATDVISEALGHRNIQVTQGYLKSIENSVVDEASALLL